MTGGGAGFGDKESDRQQLDPGRFPAEFPAGEECRARSREGVEQSAGPEVMVAEEGLDQPGGESFLVLEPAVSGQVFVVLEADRFPIDEIGGLHAIGKTMQQELSWADGGCECRRGGKSRVGRELRSRIARGRAKRTGAYLNLEISVKSVKMSA